MQYHHTTVDFNPRIPYGMRLASVSELLFRMVFQSTHPVWDATTTAADPTIPSGFQSTHPVWDATDIDWRPIRFRQFQSTHPVWDATVSFFPWLICIKFQSTHPVWDATKKENLYWGSTVQISIHASRMGCDDRATDATSPQRDFTPRSP